MCPNLSKSASQYMEDIYIYIYISTPGNTSLAHQEVLSYVVPEPPTKKTSSLTSAIISEADNANLTAKLTITQ